MRMFKAESGPLSKKANGAVEEETARCTLCLLGNGYNHNHERLNMGCGCGKKNKTLASQQRQRQIVNNPPRVAPQPQRIAPIAQPQQIQLPVNNMKPLSISPTQLPRPNFTEEDRKVRQKARQEARLRALGKI